MVAATCYLRDRLTIRRASAHGRSGGFLGVFIRSRMVHDKHMILEVVAGMASHELLVDAVSSACPLSLHALLDPFTRSRMQARSHKHIQCLSAQLMISRHQHCFTCGSAAADNPVFYTDKVPATDVNVRFAVRKRR